MCEIFQQPIRFSNLTAVQYRDRNGMEVLAEWHDLCSCVDENPSYELVSEIVPKDFKPREISWGIRQGLQDIVDDISPIHGEIFTKEWQICQTLRSNASFITLSNRKLCKVLVGLQPAHPVVDSSIGANGPPRFCPSPVKFIHRLVRPGTYRT